MKEEKYKRARLHDNNGLYLTKMYSFFKHFKKEWGNFDNNGLYLTKMY